MRLQQFIAACGLASRRRAEELIVQERVTVNGEIAQLGAKIDPLADEIAVDGRTLEPDTAVYILLNKPRGVVTTARDTHGRETVMDCLAGLRVRVFPVGRLDRDVDGALLLTNDGELAFRLTHPKFEVTKTYLAWVGGNMSRETATRLARGVMLDDGMTAPCDVKLVSRMRGRTQIELVLHEGRNREVKRMCRAVNHPVRQLTRTAFAGIVVENLGTGEWRQLRAAEIASLRTLVGMERGKPVPQDIDRGK